MRNIQKLIAFVLVLLTCSCSTDDLITESNIKTENDKIVNTSPENITSKSNFFPTYSDTQLIVQYKNGTTDPEKNNIRMANGVTNYEVCHCTNKDIELWSFGGVINIEPKRRSIKDQVDDESDTGVLAVDYEFVFGLDIESPFTGTDLDTGYTSYIKEENSGITIAIVDSGIATGLTVFNTDTMANKILFNADGVAVGDEKSGWDFVDEDANTFDDNEGKHGSIIANMITNELTTNAIPHQILPVKVSNSLGQASYFNFLCGTLYASERADIVSISMGWYDDGFGESLESIFSNIVDANPTTIYVTSAGNLSSNNDMLRHFPSSYEQENVIAVASANEDTSKISNFSNYGVLSVDFFAQGEGISFYDVFVQGTSFAAPQVTIEAAAIFYEDGILSPEELKDELSIRGSVVLESFTDLGDDISRDTYFNKLIIPFD
ncbi:S8/S53 family peptidase [Kordia algicida OT-1]|uniref:Peptidase S8 and S53, subtilisin, kexin, sedolisin n=1 Tax=Kordia algicida OT-1 TaxID=391587 RepID=A9DUH1_9FLAO|nr:S8/S53 family peptidase [Kordia algicida]EDP96290.1 peptidase S8 and S53, subtilisin, kexin, sedolisin [Kordia algicida OT-1]